MRLHKIQRIIEQCKFGIHDLSNMDLDPASGLPRFNMPLELGLFMGAKRFGEGPQKAKRLIVLDQDRYRYQKSISDISGQDVDAHNGDPETAIRRIRDWLKTVSKRKTIPGATFVIKRYRAYDLDYPGICSALKYDQQGLPFNDLLETMVEWEKLNADSS